MYRFRPMTGQDLIQLVQRCRDLQQNPNSTFANIDRVVKKNLSDILLFDWIDL